MRLPNWMLVFSLLVFGLAQYSVNAAVPAYAPVFSGEPEQISFQDESKTQININEASAQELATLPGLGAKKAMAIVEYRKLNGKFTSIEELVNVRGIGPKMLSKLTPFVVV